MVRRWKIKIKIMRKQETPLLWSILPDKTNEIKVKTRAPFPRKVRKRAVQVVDIHLEFKGSCCSFLILWLLYHPLMG